MFLQRYIRQTRTHACESLRTKRYENYNFLLYLMIIKKYKTLILRWEYQYLIASQYKYKEISIPGIERFDQIWFIAVGYRLNSSHRLNAILEK